MTEPFSPSSPPTRIRKKSSPPPVEKSGLWGKIVLWLIVAAGIGGIAAMVWTNPREKPLVCKNVVRSASPLTSFGSCTTD